MAKQKRRRTAGELLVAGLPGVVGLGLIGAGLGVIWYAKEYPPHEFSGRFVAVLLATGVACLGYWSLANKGDGYNF